MKQLRCKQGNSQRVAHITGYATRTCRITGRAAVCNGAVVCGGVDEVDGDP